MLFDKTGNDYIVTRVLGKYSRQQYEVALSNNNYYTSIPVLR